MSCSHSVSVASSLTQHPTPPSAFSQTVPSSLITAYYSQLCFSFFPLSSARLTVINLSHRSHLAITSSCRLFGAFLSPLCPPHPHPHPVVSLPMYTLSLPGFCFLLLHTQSSLCHTFPTTPPGLYILVNSPGCGGVERWDEDGMWEVSPLFFLARVSPMQRGPPHQRF